LWDDLANAKERTRRAEDEDDPTVPRYHEFFAGDPDRPVLRILSGPPASADANLLDSIPVYRTLKRRKEKEKEKEREKEKEQQGKKGNCLIA